jgi:hypothetical protein
MLNNPPRAPSLILAAAFAALLLAPQAFAASDKPEKDAAVTESSPGGTTGSVTPDPQEELKKRLEDCMSAWDRKTHMTKQQWRRTCKHLLDEKL